MQTSSHSPHDPYISDEPDFTFADLVEFVSGYWRWLLIGSVTGVLMGLVWAFSTATYQSEVVLGFIDKETALRPWEDQTMWQIQGLARVAASAGQDHSIPPCLLSEKCWKEGVKPYYRLTGTVKPMAKEPGKEASPEIVGLSVTVPDRDAGRAKDQSMRMAQFIPGAVLFLQLERLAGGYAKRVDLDLLSQASRKVMLTRDIDRLVQQLGQLEGLEEKARKKMMALTQGEDQGRIVLPDISRPMAGGIPPRNIQFVLDAKQTASSSGSSFQLKLDELQMKKIELESQQSQLIHESWVTSIYSRLLPPLQGLVKTEVRADGLAVIQSYQQAFAELRKTLEAENSNSIPTLNEVQAQLDQLLEDYRQQSRVLHAGTVRHSQFLAALTTGLLAGFLIALVSSLFQAKLKAYRESQQSPA